MKPFLGAIDVGARAGFISTRYQGDDEYSRFLLEPQVADNASSWYHIRVVRPMPCAAGGGTK